MPNNYPEWAITLVEPLFSDQFLRFEEPETATDREQRINQKIKELYSGAESIYFEYQANETKEQTRVRLNALTENQSFRGQIEHCIALLQQWISKRFTPKQVAAFTKTINTFKDHLLSDYFVDDRSLMYSEAKRNLEIMTVSLSDASFSESFLTDQITNLIGDNGLALCSGGCNTRLAHVADTLKRDFSPAQLARQFIKDVSGSVASHPVGDVECTLLSRLHTGTFDSLPGLSDYVLAHELIRYLYSSQAVNQAVAQAIETYQSTVIAAIQAALQAAHQALVQANRVTRILVTPAAGQEQTGIDAAMKANQRAIDVNQAAINTINAIPAHTVNAVTLMMTAEVQKFISANVATSEANTALITALALQLGEEADLAVLKQAVQDANQAAVQSRWMALSAWNAVGLDNLQAFEITMNKARKAIQKADQASIQAGDEGEIRRVINAAIQAAMYRVNSESIQEVDPVAMDNIKGYLDQMSRTNRMVVQAQHVADQASLHVNSIDSTANPVAFQVALQNERDKTDIATDLAQAAAVYAARYVQQVVTFPVMQAAVVRRNIQAEIQRNMLSAEVHAVSYLRNQAAKSFNLNFLLIDDPQSKHYDTHIAQSRSSRQRIEEILTVYLRALQKALTANNFVAFITAKLQEDLDAYSYADRITMLEGRLAQLGSDKGFSNIHEILVFDEERQKTLIKEKSLKITVAERLLASGYFAIIDDETTSRLRNHQSPFRQRNPANLPKLEPGNAEYKIYPANIELTWVKVADEEGAVNRRPFLEVLKEAQGIKKIKHIIPLESNFILEQLIQSSDDLTQCIVASEDISWLKNLFLLPPSDSAVDGSTLSRILGFSALYTEEPFFGRLTTYFYSLAYTWPNGIEYVVLQRIANAYPTFVKTTLSQLFSSVDDLLRTPYLNSFIASLIRVGFRDFKGLTFGRTPHRPSYDQLAGDANLGQSRVQSICIEGADLENAVFNLPLLGWRFNRASLRGVRFRSLLEGVDFTGADLSDTDFSEAKASNRDIIHDRLRNTNVPVYQGVGLDFRAAKFSTRSLTQMLQLYINLDPRFLELRDVNGDLSHFQKLYFKDVHLQSVDFSNADLHAVLKALREIEFSNIKLENKIIDFGGLSEVTIKITHSNLQDSTIKDFKGALHLTNNQLKNVIFENCDLSRAKLVKNFGEGFPLFRQTTLNLKQWCAFYLANTNIKDYSQVFLTDTPAELAEHFPQAEPSQITEIANVKLSVQAFSFLVKKGYRSFPGLDLERSDEVIILRELDLSIIELTGAKLRGVQLKDVQLTIPQFIQFYEQACRDFSGVALTGELLPEHISDLPLKGTALSREAAQYLLDKGIKNFSAVDLQHTGDLFKTYLEKAGYHFQGTIFSC